MTERQKYSVVTKYKEFELRIYQPCVIAQVSMESGYNESTSRAFRHLFTYISKGNSKEEAIAMTAPVIAAIDSSKASIWKISFVMPAGASLADLPIPNDSRVSMVVMPEEKSVAISFRGRATERLIQKMESRLRQLASDECLALSPETRVCRFDPPFKPGFMQYNEIVIPLAS
jgi:phage terminase large subunit-like protein